MLAGAITDHPEIEDFAWSKDAELDGALILSGEVDPPDAGRYCFQTTYLNEEYPAYLNATAPFRLVWLLRNPRSVVYSMLYNWRRFALNELFTYCGAKYLAEPEARRFAKWGLPAVRPITRACLSYKAKIRQAMHLSGQLPDDAMLPVEYETLVSEKEQVLREICDFADLVYHPSMGDRINTRSLDKARQLTAGETRTIEQLCDEDYEAARSQLLRSPA
jgi:hypothetical protein